MAKEEKSVIEQALLEAEQIDATFKANAKEILTQTMGSEIEEMVKESLKGSEQAIKEDEDNDLDLVDDLDLDLEDEDEDIDGELDLDLPELEDNEGEELELDMDVIDLTDMDNDEELIRVFKNMNPDDEIEVVQTEDGIEFTDNETGAEYKIELGDSEDDEMEIELDSDNDELEIELGDDEDEEMEDEETIYEIVIDEDEDEEDKDEMEEASRTLGSGRRFGKKGLNKPKASPRHLKNESRKPKFNENVKTLKENKVLKNKLRSLETENRELKENQTEMVDALKQFRQKLQEVAVFNSNLAHVVRLFTENTTTKEEKVDIVKRMDEAKSLKESKIMFKTIMKELEGSKTKKSIQETIDNKVNKTASTGSKEIITESKVYVHPDLEKMKKMWEFNYKY